MDEIKQLFGEAHERIEIAERKLADFDFTGKYADVILLEAWDLLRTVAKLVDEARRRLRETPDIDPGGEYDDDRLHEAWGKLRTAAKLLVETRRGLKSGAA
jgi:hypothetical protein